MNSGKTTAIKDFTQGNISSQLMRFALPLFLSNLLQVVYNMVDMIIVGNTMGKVGISAVSVGGDVSHFLTFIAMGFGSAGQVIIARYIGEKQKDKLSTFVGTMCSFLFCSAVIISVLGFVFRHQMLRLMSTPEQAYEGALVYSVISMAGLVFIYGYNIVSAILRGMGDARHPFIFISIAAVLNVVLDLLFVCVFQMGPGGAALATVISQGVSFVACAIFLFKNKEKFELQFKAEEFLHWDKEMLSDLVKLGVPMAIKTASIQISRLFVNSWVNSYGIAVSAFAGIGNKVSNTANLISAALNTAGSTMVGQNIGAKNYGRVKKVMLELAKITIPAATLVSLCFVFFPDQIFGIFTDEAEVLAIGRTYVPICIMLFYGSAMRCIMNALMNGSGNHSVNFATAILDGFILRIGLSLLFGLYFDMKHIGFWLGDALACFTPFFIGLAFYYSGRWKKENHGRGNETK